MSARRFGFLGIVFFLLAVGSDAAGARRALPAAERIDWPDFFAEVSIRGVQYSEKLRSLEGKRVRLRGFSIPVPAVPGGLLLGREPFAASDAEETEVPYDVVGVLWRESLVIPPPPVRPTVEGNLRLGNRLLGEQSVTVTLEDAVPVFPAKLRTRRR